MTEAATTESLRAPGELGLRRVGYLARQPILNRRGGVFGYELRFHDPAGDAAPSKLAAGSALIDALALFGVERFAGGQWAFLRCTEQMLLDEMFEGLPPAMTVLEIPSQATPAPRLLRICRRGREAGFRLALTEFEPGNGHDALLGYADYVKIDVTRIDTPGWQSFSKQAQSSSPIVIACNIQTHEAWHTARTAGIKYFQGYYFCSPDLIPNGAIPANRAYHLEILRELFKDPLDLKVLGPLVARDASLIYRVLRFVNSPLCAMRQVVTSIESAIMILGDTAFRRIATLAIQCGLNRDQSPELLNMAVVRARFCSLAAPLCGLEPEEQYILGMLSLLPPMLGVPMELILPGLPLRGAVRDALAGASVRERSLLTWIEELEHDKIAECEELAARYGLDNDHLMRTYLGAIEAAGSISALTGEPA
jgi:EAL and modified HD-GYP domain-containing signal transduction protein